MSTAPAEVKFVFLVRNGSKVEPINFHSSEIGAVEPVKEKKEDIPFVSIEGKTKGTYYGYICGIYQDGKIVQCKSNPASYARDPESAAQILSFAESRGVSEKVQKPIKK